MYRKIRCVNKGLLLSTFKNKITNLSHVDPGEAMIRCTPYKWAANKHTLIARGWEWMPISKESCSCNLNKLMWSGWAFVPCCLLTLLFIFPSSLFNLYLKYPKHYKKVMQVHYYIKHFFVTSPTVHYFFFIIIYHYRSLIKLSVQMILTAGLFRVTNHLWKLGKGCQQQFVGVYIAPYTLLYFISIEALCFIFTYMKYV